MLEVTDPARAAGHVGAQIDVQVGGISRVIEPVGAADAAINRARDSLAGAEHEEVVGAAAGQVLDRREAGQDCTGRGEVAGVTARDLEGAGQVGADQCVGTAATVERSGQ